jgi:hypothetical protein
LPAATPEVRRADDVPRRSWPGLALAVGLATGALAGSAITLVSLAAGFGHPLVAWLHDRLTGAPPVQSAAPAVVSVAPPASDPATRSVRPEVSPGEPIPAPVAEPRQTSAEAPAPPVAPVAAHEQSAPSDSAPAPASDATLPAPPEARPREPTATVLAEPDPATTGAPGRARLRGAIHEQPAPSPSSSQHVRKRESNVGEEPDDPAQCGASEDATEGDDDCDGAVP